MEVGESLNKSHGSAQLQEGWEGRASVHLAGEVWTLTSVMPTAGYALLSPVETGLLLGLLRLPAPPLDLPLEGRC